MAWENYPVRGNRIPPYEAISMDFEPAWITTECANCGKTRHALGVYCHPVGFWLTAALFAAAIAAIVAATIVRICT